jgi:hypothetical protein
MWRFAHPIAQRWIDFIARALKPVGATMVLQDCARITARPTTRRFCSIRMATTSRLFARDSRSHQCCDFQNLAADLFGQTSLQLRKFRRRLDRVVSRMR